MLKRMSTMLGIGLTALWIAGLGSPNTDPWLSWLDGLAALCAFAIAGFTPSYASKGARVGGPIALSVGLFVLWMIGLGTGAVSWLVWWTFAFACAFLALGIATSYERKPPMVEPASAFEREREREKTRRSA